MARFQATAREPVRLREPLPPRSRPVRVNSADLAQARLFDAVLRGEIAELRDVAASTEARWMRRRQRGAGDDQPPEELLELRARLKETQRLLDNLRDRFPQD